MDTDSKRLATIPADAEVSVVSNPQKGWYDAEYNNISGYARTKYVKKTSSVTYPEAESASGTDSACGAVAPHVRCDINANVRSGPGTGNDIIGTLPANTSVVIKFADGKWYFVEGGGLAGYVHSNCIINK